MVAPTPTPRPVGTKQVKPLHKAGALCPQWMRCGTPTCRCTRGELHGPYWCLFWRQDGRLRKRYVRPTDLDAVRAACEAERDRCQRQRLVVTEARRAWRELLPLLREVERHDRP